MNEPKFCVRIAVWQFLLYLILLLLMLFIPYGLKQLLFGSEMTGTVRIIFFAAGIIWFLIIFFFFLMLIDESLKYIKVDGQTFLVSTGFRGKYQVTCDDLKSVSCHKVARSSGRGVNHCINILFEDKKLVQIDWNQKNFRKLAQYFYDMHKAGVIAQEVIPTQHKETLFRYSNGNFCGQAKI